MHFRFTIGRKLGLGFGVLIIAIAVNIILTYITLNNTNESRKKISEIYTPSISKLKDLNTLILRTQSLTINWLEDDKSIDEVENKKELQNLHQKEFPVIHEELIRLSEKWEPENKEDFKIVLLEIDTLRTKQREIMNRFRTENNYYYPSDHVQERFELKRQFSEEDGRFLIKINRIKDLINATIDRQQDNANNYSREMAREFNTLTTYVTWVGILLVFGGVCVAYFTSRSIVNPVNNLKNVLLIMGKGILPNRKIQTRSDEIGEMSIALNSLVEGLKETSNFAKEIGEANFDSEYEPLSAEDTLGNSLILMRDNLRRVSEEDRRRNWSTGGLAKFGEILRSNSDNVTELSFELISELVKYMDANQGGVFLLNNDDEENPFMELAGCYAWDRPKYLEQKIEKGDGLVGQSWQERDTLYITDVPRNYINITSGLGDANPKCILIVPMVLNEEVFGVIEIASFEEIQSYQVKFVERLAETTASTIQNVKVNQRTKQLLAQAQMASEQMRTQEEELRHNQEEMTAKQHEMEKELNDYKTRLIQLENNRDHLKEENHILQNILLKTSKELDKYKQEN